MCFVENDFMSEYEQAKILNLEGKPLSSFYEL